MAQFLGRGENNINLFIFEIHKGQNLFFYQFFIITIFIYFY